jgi:hypothetical protein
MRIVFACVLMIIVAGCTAEQWERATSMLGTAGDGQLDARTVAAGLKEALRVGTQRAVEEASSQGGYLNDPELHISLPGQLGEMADTLRSVGLGGQVDALERRMNRAAEEAAAQAAPVFMEAIAGITFEDARQILTGGETAATDYLRRATSDELRQEYRPVVERHLKSVGVIDLYNRLMDRYQALPLAPAVDFRPRDYVTDEALNGLFSLLAEEERKIRANPAARTTELLRTVFGGNSGS